MAGGCADGEVEEQVQGGDEEERDLYSTAQYSTVQYSTVQYSTYHRPLGGVRVGVDVLVRHILDFRV